MKAKYLVIDYDEKSKQFIDSQEELKNKAYEALEYCEHNMDAVKESFDFIDLETGEYIGMQLDITFFFPNKD